MAAAVFAMEVVSVGVMYYAALAEFMFLGLRLTEGVSFVRFRQRFGKEMDTVYGKELQELAELGLLLRDESGVRLSRRGIDVSNAVFERFLL